MELITVTSTYAPQPASDKQLVFIKKLITERAEALKAMGVEIAEVGTLERAVELAAAEATPGDVVLLSPACASFDAFKDFEQRGDRFRELVEALP